MAEGVRYQHKSKWMSLSSVKIPMPCNRRRRSAGNIRLAVVRRPFDKALVHEAPRGMLRVDLHQHVGVRGVPSGSHDVVLRTVVAMIVDPLVLVTGDNKLDSVLVFA